MSWSFTCGRGVASSGGDNADLELSSYATELVFTNRLSEERYIPDGVKNTISNAVHTLMQVASSEGEKIYVSYITCNGHLNSNGTGQLGVSIQIGALPEPEPVKDPTGMEPTVDTGS